MIIRLSNFIAFSSLSQHKIFQKQKEQRAYFLGKKWIGFAYTIFNAKD